MKPTNSYNEFKERIQDIFNFAVLVTVSVPVLKHNLKLYSDDKIGRIVDPDYFEPSVIYEITQKTIDELKSKGIEDLKLRKLEEIINVSFNSTEFKNTIKDIVGEDIYKEYRHIINRQSKSYVENIKSCSLNYQKKLATYLYFSTFSYFEAFISDLSQEIIERFERFDVQNHLDIFKKNEDILADISKLKKTTDKRKLDRYKKYSQLLKDKGYIQPEILMFNSFIDLYKSNVENLKANDIPSFLLKNLFFSMSEQEIQDYNNFRSNRNSIGHGNKQYSPNLNDVIKVNKYLKKLSQRLDEHVSFYLIKIENYVN